MGALLIIGAIVVAGYFLFFRKPEMVGADEADIPAGAADPYIDDAEKQSSVAEEALIVAQTAGLDPTLDVDAQTVIVAEQESQVAHETAAATLEPEDIAAADTAEANAAIARKKLEDDFDAQVAIVTDAMSTAVNAAIAAENDHEAAQKLLDKPAARLKLIKDNSREIFDVYMDNCTVAQLPSTWGRIGDWLGSQAWSLLTLDYTSDPTKTPCENLYDRHRELRDEFIHIMQVTIPNLEGDIREVRISAVEARSKADDCVGELIALITTYRVYDVLAARIAKLEGTTSVMLDTLKGIDDRLGIAETQIARLETLLAEAGAVVPIEPPVPAKELEGWALVQKAVTMSKAEGTTPGYLGLTHWSLAKQWLVENPQYLAQVPEVPGYNPEFIKYFMAGVPI